MQKFFQFFSQYSPLKSLMQFLFQRIMGTYLKNKVDYSNFALGVCNLKNLDLDEDQLNKNFFKSAPYKMKSGTLKNFSINIPWMSILSDSIEVIINEMEINFVYNKDFSFENFSSNKSDEDNLEDDEKEEHYNTQINVFKKIVNKILLNMKINISKIVIKVFLNDPSEHKNSPYLLINVEKFEIWKKKRNQKMVQN